MYILTYSRVETTPGKCNVIRPPARWDDDMSNVAGNGWMRRAEDRCQRREFREAYIQQWTRQADNDDEVYNNGVGNQIKKYPTFFS